MNILIEIRSFQLAELNKLGDYHALLEIVVYVYSSNKIKTNRERKQ